MSPCVRAGTRAPSSPTRAPARAARHRPGGGPGSPLSGTLTHTMLTPGPYWGNVGSGCFSHQYICVARPSYESMVSYSLTGHGEQHQEENVAGGVADELYEGVLDVLSCNNSVTITSEGEQ